RPLVPPTVPVSLHDALPIYSAGANILNICQRTKEVHYMLTRRNYYDDKRDKIKQLVMDTVDDLMEMKNYYAKYLDDPTAENKDFILETENYVDNNEKKIEKSIQNIISLQSLDKNEIKWLFTMSRIIRELERVGDQLTNIITISNVSDTTDIQPMIQA